jgi:hypothetical protein
MVQIKGRVTLKKKKKRVMLFSISTSRLNSFIKGKRMMIIYDEVGRIYEGRCVILQDAPPESE